MPKSNSEWAKKTLETAEIVLIFLSATLAVFAGNHPPHPPSAFSPPLTENSSKVIALNKERIIINYAGL